ncbi:YjbQ family protein [Candidatus Kaiserbacteria bacterium]|nr:YjbQ family protein [Candidatus Kaiserbacteria bacterium]
MAYKVATKTLSYQTLHRLEFINITQEVEAFVENSGVQTGTVTLQAHHTTCGLWVNEDEKNLIGPEKTLGYTPDLQRILDRFAHPAEEYHHNDIRDINNPKGKRHTHLCLPDEHGVVHECINGHAHAHNMVLPSYLTLIIENGKLIRGEWQQVLFIELDHDRSRKVTMLAQGEA